MTSLATPVTLLLEEISVLEVTASMAANQCSDARRWRWASKASAIDIRASGDNLALRPCVALHSAPLTKRIRQRRHDDKFRRRAV